MRSALVAALAAVVVVAPPARANAPLASRPTVVFITDFGVIDDSVAICKGVMLGICPEVSIVDLTHQVTPYSILDGARFLAGAAPYFGAGTIFVGVIDPGVGSARKPIVARTKRGLYFVVPDNGLLTLVAQKDEIVEAREISNPEWMIGGKLSSTFHGRDVFSAAAAHLARGEDYTRVGSALPIKDLLKLPIQAPTLDDKGLHGEVLALDGPFGNLVTNVDEARFHELGYAVGSKVEVQLGSQTLSLLYVHTFSDVPTGKPLLYVDSRGRMSLAVNQGNFATTYKITVPPSLPLTFARKPR